MGSPRFHAVEVDGLQITRAWFPPQTTLPPHHHDRTVFAVLLGGSIDSALTRRTFECSTDSVWTEPAGERHGNRVHAGGAEVLVVQPDSGREELFRPCAEMLSRADTFHHAGIAGMARGIVREMECADELMALALEASALEMLVTAARAAKDDRGTNGPPAWLARVEQIVHDRFREPLRVDEIAREVGVHPVHLGRVFRQHKRLPLARYIRALRIEWAAEQLRSSDASLAAVALRAGFADQSHFTRAFKRHIGRTPGQFRALAAD